MQRKTKINVLLPFKMVGELEERSRLGKRSQFIQDAIRNKLDSKDSFTIDDIETHRLVAIVYNRLCTQIDDTPLCGIARSVLLEWINQ